MAAVPEFGRAARVEPSTPPGADATRELFERFSSQIYGYCLHQLGSREEAEDAVQTTFMNVYRGLQRGIVPRVEGAWLFKIAQNVCLSRRRSTRRRGRVEAPNNFEVLQDVVPARERSTDELIRLNDALQGMPEAQRRAILLREWQGLSYREIAERIGISQAAVETLIFRARRSLAAGLEKTDDGGWRKRARHGVDAGGVLAALKSIFATGTTVKVAATVAAVATTAVAAEDVSHHARSTHHADVRTRVVAVPTAHLDVVRDQQRHFAHAPTAYAVPRPVDVSKHVAIPSAARHASSKRAIAERPASVVHASLAPPQPEPRPSPRPSRSAAHSETPKSAPVATPKPPKVKAGKIHANRAAKPSDQAPAPKDQPTATAEKPVAQSRDEHGTETAPGQQDKSPTPDDHGGNGSGNDH